MAKFRKYGSVAEGIRGYYEFLQYPRYANLKGVTDYKKACDLIRQDGWATSLSYSQTLQKYVEAYGLVLWDLKTVGGVAPEKYLPGTYEVSCNGLKVRSGPGVNYPQKRYDEMTESAQRLNPEYAEKGVAAYKKGTRFTAQEIVKVSDDEYWAKTPSGYVCLEKGVNKYVSF